ncbi:battenin-like [Oppia nitens]|uniref:battenin-like n=1 Tax=Oppia nitens TaxID=1686743 RepID=UPI0023DADCF7|nr:battenin-like [Oppia nitens]
MNWWNKYRNHISFWILGLSNNYSYVIMLSAAFDIIAENDRKPGVSGGGDDITADDYDDNNNNKNSTTFQCNSSSTGAVLIADILPCLIIKLLAPFVFTNTNFRVSLVVILSAMSFILTSISTNIYYSYIGIVCASLSSGLGETTYLSYTSKFDLRVISYWSSGTGASGLLGSLSYAFLTTIGLTPKTTLLVMLVIPVLMAFTFWCIITEPTVPHDDSIAEVISPLICDESTDGVDDCTDETIVLNPNNSGDKMTIWQMIVYIKSLLKYMLPLMFVYLFEYFINQGLFELVYFPGIWLTQKEQYRWYNVDYQIGVLISRSSISFLKIQKLYLLAILQLVNVLIVLTQLWTQFMPTIWIMLALVLFEGLLGGAAYVNTFYRIYSEVNQKYKSYALSITTLSDSIGITIAGFTALPVHDAICEHLKY